jgi:hypothetical protein
MAIKTLYLLNTTAASPDWNGSLQDGGTAPSAAVSTFGWTVAKTSTAYWQARIGATAAATTTASTSYIATAVGPNIGTGSGATTAGDTFSSTTPYTGIFAAGTWAFTFAMRCTTSSSQAGHINFRVWASPNASGANARELTSGSILGSTITLATTTTTYNSTANWSAPQIVLNNEYLFVQVEWQVTTAGGSNSCDVKFYQSAALFTTTDFQASTGKTFYVLNTTATAPGWFGSLQDGGAAPATTNSQFGWVPSTTPVTTPYFPGFIGATGASPTFSATSALSASTGPKAGTGNTFSTAGDSFISPAAYYGTFAAGTWTLNWAMRGSTVASTGQINCRIWASTNANGSGARQLTSGVLQGSIVNITSTTVTYISTVSWSAPAITLNGEYLFFQMEWQETTVGTNSNSIASFYIGSANILTGNFSASVFGPLASTDLIDTSAIAGQGGIIGSLSATDLIDTSAIAAQLVSSGTLAATDLRDTSAIAGLVAAFGTLAATDLVDTAGIAGTVDWRAVLAATDAVDTAAIAGSLGPAGVVGTLATTEALDAPQSVTTAAMLASYTPGNTRTGSFWVGAFIIPTTNQTVTQIGCLGGGNSGSTTVTLVDQSSGAILADTTVNLSAPSANGFCYGPIPATTLIAGNNYVVAANSAPMGGWADVNGSYATYGPDFTGNGGCYNGSEGGPYTAAGGYAYWQYVGVDLVYGTVSAGFSGAVAWQAALVATDPPDLAAISGQILAAINAALAVTDPPDVSAIAGTVTGIAGALAATDTPDVSAAAGRTEWSATLAASDHVDTAAIAATVAWQGALSATDKTDTASVSGTAQWNAALAASDPTDSALFSGTVFTAVTGSLAANDPVDTASLACTVLSGLNGGFGLVEPLDGAAIAGQVTGVAGSLVAVDAIDVAALSGRIAWQGALAASEPLDTAGFVGGIIATGTLAATDPADQAGFAGSVSWTALLSVVEPRDTAAVTASVAWAATLAAVDPVDHAALAGSVVNEAGLDTVEPADSAAIAGGIIGSGFLVATEPADFAVILATVTDAGSTAGVPGSIPDVPYDRQSSETNDRLVVAGNGGRVVVAGGAGRVAGNGANRRVVLVSPAKRAA